MTMTYDILAIIGVNKVGVSLPPPFYFSLRTGSLEDDSGGRRRREGEGGGSGNWVSFFGSWMGAKLGFDIRDPELG